jgi:hypothetical protein
MLAKDNGYEDVVKLLQAAGATKSGLDRASQ